MSEPLLLCRGVEKQFFGVRVLKGVDLSLGAGRVLGLLGENGAGKSTLMNILGGVLSADAGTIALSGAPYSPANPQEAAERGAALIHQELNLFPNLSIAENMFLTRLPRRGWLPFIDRAQIRRRAQAALEAVDLRVSPDALVATLAPGERQLVEIARAFSLDARVVIFDEPTTSLTARECERLFQLIERLRAEGRAIIYISHVLGDVFRLCDDLVVLRDGAVVGTGLRTELDVHRVISMMVGRPLDQMFPPSKRQRQQEVVLNVNGLGHPGVVEDVSFSLHAGEIVGIAGLMGAGRTEIARMLFGLDPGEGRIALAGKPFDERSPGASVRRGLAFLTENRREEGLLMDASVEENMALAALPRFARRPATVVDQPRLHGAVQDMAKTVALRAHDLFSQPVRTLSGGNQQKVVFAKWLLAKPRVLILDEPTRGIDVGARYELYKLVDELAAAGAGVLWISSELEELMGMCDRILVMSRGVMTGEFARSAFDREAILRAAFGEVAA